VDNLVSLLFVSSHFPSVVDTNNRHNKDANIVGNYFISGPSTSVTAFTRGNENFHGYVENNYYDPDQDGTLNGNELGVSSSNYGGMDIVDTKYDYPAAQYIMTPDEAVSYVTESKFPPAFFLLSKLGDNVADVNV
jgi:hypothetical protein